MCPKCQVECNVLCFANTTLQGAHTQRLNLMDSVKMMDKYDILISVDHISWSNSIQLP